MSAIHSRHFHARSALALLGACLGLVQTAHAATIVVTDAGDPGNGVCDSVCTLREAITQANSTAIVDTINFAIPTPIKTEILIAPATALPTITKPLIINGYSQTFTSINTLPAGTNAKLRVRIDGASVAAGLPGLAICANGVTVKGLSITGFDGAGVSFGKPTSSSQCPDPITSGTLSGSFIGLRSDGSSAGGNDGGGVVVLNAVVTVGGSLAEDRNVISGNSNGGIRIVNDESDGSSIQGNQIGTDRSGLQDRGNNGPGVVVESFAGPVAIGGQSANVIAFNTRGVSMSSLGTGASFYPNNVFSNDELGFDLGTLGVTPNDPGGGDADGGANDQQNFPEITAASRVAGGLSISGKLEVSNAPLNPKSYRLAFYASAACDASGNGEGERFLGSVTRALSTAFETFTIASFATSDPLPPGTVITATATDPGGSTSEFSACFALDPPPLVVNTNADTDDGTCNGANCTLREAINAANARAGADVISFAIGSGLKVISTFSALPTITDTVAIDGYTQPGASPNTLEVGDDAVIAIQLDGPNAGASTSGLGICADDTVIRGLSVTRFKQAGIRVGTTNTGSNCAADPSDVVVAGNFIGLLPNGTAGGNLVEGINVRLSDGTRIGGSAAADRNVISANGGDGGIVISQPSNGRQVANNYIGTDPGGSLARGNAGAGVLLSTNADNMAVGELARNRIAFNASGIRIVANSSGTGNTLARNDIFDNVGLGIELDAQGVTENDTDDEDIGANNVQNFPELTLARRSAGGLRVEGSLDVPAGTDGEFRIAFYANDACDPSGHGEGERFLGSRLEDLTDGDGEGFAFDLATDDPLPEPTFITATATAGGSTSEFSACIEASDPSANFVVTSAADAGGTTCGATCTLRQAINAANLQQGRDTVSFAIPGGAATIAPATPLPTITEGLVIDGYTQPGASDNALEEGDDAVILIRIDGAGAGAPAYGLGVCGGDTEIRGLSITRFNGAGVGIGFDAAGAECADTPSRILVAGNFIGLAPDGGAAGNEQGVRIGDLALVLVGGPDPRDRNIISANGGSGVAATGPTPGRRVDNNYIGTDPSGGADRGNVEGILVGDGCANLQLGSLVPNRIAFNQYGIKVVPDAGNRNRFHDNEFFSNDTLGIDLEFDGVTPNDADDADTGGNDTQNFPVLTDVVVGAQGFTVSGTLDVPAAADNATYRIVLYESASCDASGNGEGQIPLASLAAKFSGDAESFSLLVKMPPPDAGHVLTATATDPLGSTSEFSACLVVPAIPELFSDGFED